MAVKEALEKIVERHPDVIGAMVRFDGNVQHTLEAPYDVIAADTILETFEEIIEQTAILADEGYDFGEFFVDYPTHSFIVRAIEGGVLAVLSTHLQRGQLVKLHVGLGIFGKSVQKAIADEAETAVTPPDSDAEPDVADPMDDGSGPDLIAPMDATIEADGPVLDESSLGRSFKKRRGGFRGTKQLLANRLQRATESKPAPQADEPMVNADGVPLNPDGTPKKKRIYRGSVFYE